jgi:hypothetical protein
MHASSDVTTFEEHPHFIRIAALGQKIGGEARALLSQRHVFCLLYNKRPIASVCTEISRLRIP